MVSIGETAGNLGRTLLYLSDHFEKEVSDMTKNLSSSLEPILLVSMGLIVGFVAVSVITPIYELTQNLHP
jgi:type II secretory pathway component PulF